MKLEPYVEPKKKSRAFKVGDRVKIVSCERVPQAVGTIANVLEASRWPLAADDGVTFDYCKLDVHFPPPANQNDLWYVTCLELVEGT